jgi:Mce-associated membrane protein
MSSTLVDDDTPAQPAAEHVNGVLSEVNSEDHRHEDDEMAESSPAGRPPRRRAILSRVQWKRVAVYGLLPVLALLLAVVSGWLKWQGTSVSAQVPAATEAVQAARAGTVALLSYSPGTAAKNLGAARDLMTGQFRDSYTQLVNDVVIPGAQQQHIQAVATVPAAASVSATETHAVVLLCVNQTTIIGNDAPSSSASSVRVTLERVGPRWLISGFDPV